MKPPTEPQSADTRIPPWIVAAPSVASIVAVSVGTLGLIGWTDNIELLKRGVHDIVAMNPTSAVLFVLAGAALRIEAHGLGSKTWAIIGRGLSLIVVLVGLTKLLDIAVGWLPNVDEMFFAAKLGTSPDVVPSRMAPNTALNFLFL